MVFAPLLIIYVTWLMSAEKKSLAENTCSRTRPNARVPTFGELFNRIKSELSDIFVVFAAWKRPRVCTVESRSRTGRRDVFFNIITKMSTFLRWHNKCYIIRVYIKPNRIPKSRFAKDNIRNRTFFFFFVRKPY